MASTRIPRTASVSTPGEAASQAAESGRAPDAAATDVLSPGQSSAPARRAPPQVPPQVPLQAPIQAVPERPLPAAGSQGGGAQVVRAGAGAPAGIAQVARPGAGSLVGAAAASAARAGRGVLLYAGLTGTAPIRNDDRWQVAADVGLLLVADGVSGYPAGDLAAELAVQTVCQLVPDLLRYGLAPAEALARAIGVCNDEIREFAAGRPDCAGMATTLVCALVDGDRLHLAHVGDSRAYLLRDGRLSRLTRDHCVGQQIVDAGRLTEAEVASLPARGILTRALGLADQVEPELASLGWQASDTLVLCSDGLTQALSDPILEHLLQAAAPRGPVGQVNTLIGGALQTGLTANVTALVATAADSHGPGNDPDRSH